MDRPMNDVDEVNVCSPEEARCDHCSHSRRGEQEASIQKPNLALEPPPIVLAPKVLLRQARREEQEITAYRDSLEAVKGSSTVCRIRGLQDWQHSFCRCRHVHKWKYVNAKQEVLLQSQQNMVDKFDACFHCLQPQTLCQRLESGHCGYKDLVKQAVFAQFELDPAGERWLRRFGVRFDAV